MKKGIYTDLSCILQCFGLPSVLWHCPMVAGMAISP